MHYEITNLSLARDKHLRLSADEIAGQRRAGDAKRSERTPHVVFCNGYGGHSSEETISTLLLLMTSRQIQLIQESFALVAPSADSVATSFYERLFELDPALRSLFPPDLTEQRRKLMQMLTVAVGMLNRPEALIPVLESLGRRHAGYGVRDEHYDTVGAALLWTLERGLGAAFTNEVRTAWTTLYKLVATTMQAAAGTESPDPEPALAS